MTARKLELGGSFTEDYYQMIPGQEEAQSNTYKIALGKTGKIWLYSTGDNIYAQGGPKSDGFGGATLEFKLANGCDSIKLKGPWHTNSESFYRDTGIDIRDQHLTIGVIGRGRSHNNGRSVIDDIIWFDPEPIYGLYNRVQDLATKLSDERGECLYYHMQSKGGGSCGPVNYNKYTTQAYR